MSAWGKCSVNGLRESEVTIHRVTRTMTHNYIVHNPIIFPHYLRIKCSLASTGVLLGPQCGIGSVKVGGGRGATEMPQMRYESEASMRKSAHRTHHPLTTPARITCSG